VDDAGSGDGVATVAAARDHEPRAGRAAGRLPTVLCVDLSLDPSIDAMLSGHGFEVVARTDRAIEVVEAVGRLQPRLAVIEVSRFGQLGGRLLQLLRAAAEDCRVIVVSDLPGVAADLLAGGATAIVDPSDLRQLGTVLAGLRSERAS
jgi:DNA-binding response OmpR family regulator